MRTPLVLVCTLVSLVAFAEPGVYTVKSDESVLTYHVTSAGGLDKVASHSHSVQGGAHVTPGGAVTVEVRVPVASFDSHNEKRDAKMRTVTEAERYPDVVVKATADGLTIPTTFPSAVTKTMKAQVEFHGLTQTVDAPVTLYFDSASKVVATVFLKLSLGAFKVERPKMMLFQVADDLKIEGKITLVP